MLFDHHPFHSRLLFPKNGDRDTICKWNYTRPLSAPHWQGESGTETTVAFAVLLLKQLLDRGVVSAVVKPWEGCRREFGDGASPEGRSEQGADSNDLSRRAPHLHALVVTRNRDIASNVMVRN